MNLKKTYVEKYGYERVVTDRNSPLTYLELDFLKLADGSLDPVFAFTTGKLKVEGSLEKALEFQKITESVKKKIKKKK